MIQGNVTIFIILIMAALVITIAMVIYLYMRLRALESESEMLARDTEGHNIVELVNTSMLQVEGMEREVQTLTDKYDYVVKRLAGALRNVGIVRFDAFRDLGGRMSFAVALLDDRGNGIVISSIYGRSESRTYAKPVVERKSKYDLSPEEEEAIRLASLNKELGALPEEWVDKEHRDRMESLRLFHGKDVTDYPKEEGRTVERAAQSPKAREQVPGGRASARSSRARDASADREEADLNGANEEKAQRKTQRRAAGRHHQGARARRSDSPTERLRDRDSERG